MRKAVSFLVMLCLPIFVAAMPYHQPTAQPTLYMTSAPNVDAAQATMPSGLERFVTSPDLLTQTGAPKQEGKKQEKKKAAWKVLPLERLAASHYPLRE